jgi:hypothetical protein
VQRFVFPEGGRVLALDPASTTGFAYGAPDADAPEIGSVKFSREHDVRADVFGRAVAWWRMRMQTRQPHLLVIEPPIPPGDLWGKSNYDSTVILHGLYAIFIGLAMEWPMPVIEAPTRTWRKYFLGMGNLRRDEAKLAAKRMCRRLKWGDPLTSDENACEAAGIWAFGCAQVEPTLVRRIEPLFVGGRE